MSAATESNSGTIFMINRNNYKELVDNESIPDKPHVDTNSVYLVRENVENNSKIISMYLGYSKQADIIDVSGDLSVGYDEVTREFDLGIKYQIKEKMLFCPVPFSKTVDNERVPVSPSEVEYYRAFMWNGIKYVDWANMDTSSFVTKDEHGNVVITGTLSSGDFTSSGNVGVHGTISSDGNISSGGTVASSGNITSSNGNVMSYTGAALTTQRDSISGTIGQHYVDACLPSNGYEVLLSNSATNYAEIIDVEISDISTMIKGNTTTDRTNDYCCTYIFRKSAATTEAEDLFTNFTSANTSETTDVSNNPPKIYLLNPDIDISQFTVIHVFVFYDGIAVCAIVGGYEYTFPVQP